MYVRLNPEKSYWEAQWRFPPMGTVVSLTLPGPVAGPLAESKSFYALLASRFETLLALGVPKIEQVFKKLFIEN
jgi:hypothetical protein